MPYGRRRRLRVGVYCAASPPRRSRGRVHRPGARADTNRQHRSGGAQSDPARCAGEPDSGSLPWLRPFPMIIRPTARFLFAHPAHFLALGFGSGLAPVAPGTFGTLLGFPIYSLLADRLGPGGLLGAVARGFVLGL